MPLDLALIQAICFDADGTLRDTDEQYIGRVAQVMRPFRWLMPNGDPNPFARWLVMRLQPMVNSAFALIDRLGLDGPVYRYVEFVNPWKGRKGMRYQLVPGTHAAIKELAEHYPLAIVTARGGHSTQRFLEESDLDSYFHCVASGLTSPRNKPLPDPIIWAAGQMGVSPESCLMVGDTGVDIRAGIAAGAQTVGVLSGFGEEARLKKLGADLVLGSVADLPAALDLEQNPENG